MNPNRLHLLIAEDEAAHVEAIRRAYEAAGIAAEIRAVGTLREFRACARERPPDLALIDLNLPDGRAVEVLTHPPEDALFPILVMTAFGNQQIVVEVMKAGALDYVVKSPEAFATMPRTVEHALREWELLQKHRQAEKQIRFHAQLLDGVTESVVATDLEGRILYWGRGAEKLYGYKAEEVLGKPYRNFAGASEPPDEAAFRKEILAKGSWQGEHLQKNRGGGTFWTSTFISLVRDERGQPTGYIGIDQDVTERKQVENALKQSEKRFRQVAETAGEWIWEMDAAGVYTYSNPVVETILGYSPEELVGKKNFLDLFAPEVREEIRQAAAERSARQEGFLKRVNPVLHKDGHVVILETTGEPIVDAQGRLTGYRGADTDISERKQAEAALRDSESRLQKIFDILPIGLWFADKTGKLLRGNPAGVKIWGAEPRVDPSEYGVFKARRLPSGAEIAPDDWALAHTIREGTTILDELLEIDAIDGRKKIILNSTAPVLDDNGAVQGAVIVNQDVTERKQAEEDLQRKQAMLARTEALAHVGSWEWEVATDTVIWSDELFRIFRRDPALGAPSFAEHPALYAPEDFRRLNEAVEAALRDGTPYEIELRAICMDGVTRTGLAIGQAEMKDGRVVRLSGSFQDVTDRKQAEAALREAGEYLDRIINAIGDPVFVKDEHCKFVLANDALCALLGIARNELLGTTAAEFLPPDQMDHFLEVDRKVLSSGEENLCEEALTASDGSIRTIVTRKTRYVNIQGARFVVGVIRDVTDRKQTETALRESEATHRSIFNASPDDITLADLDGRILMASRAALKMFGFQREDQLIGRPVADFLVPGDRERAAADIARMFQGSFSGPGEYRALRADGTLFDIEVNGEFIRDETGQPFRMVLIVRDATDRKRAEEAMRQSEEKFAQIFRTSPYAVALSHAENGRFIDVNPAFTALTGFSREEALADSSVGLGLWAHLKDRQRVTDDLRKGAPVIDREYAIRTKSGGLVTGLFSAQILRLGDENCILSSINDITARKQAEAALQESEQRHRDYLAHSPYGIFVADEKGRYVQVNPAACRLTGYSEKELLAMTIPDIHGEESREDAARHFQAVVREGKAAGELKFRTKSGESRWWLVSAVKISDTRFLGFCNDVTDRKQAEAALRESETLYRSILNASPDDITITDLEGRILMVSPSALRIFGCERADQLVGHRVFEFIDPGERARAAADIVQLNQGATSGPIGYRGEYRGLRADGSLFDIEVNGEFIRDETGQPLRMILIVRDITQRKQIEMALKGSETRYRTFIDATSDLVFLKDETFRYLISNRANSAFLGKAETDVIGRTDFDLMLPEVAAQCRAGDQEALRKGKSVTAEETAGEQTYQTVKFPVSLPSGRTGVGGFIRDITNRKQAEEKLQASAERFRDLAANIPGAIYQLQTGRTGALEVPYMSSGCEALFGRPLAGLDFTGLLFDHMHVGDRALFQHSLAKAAKRLERWSLEFRTTTPDGGTKWLRGSANPRRTPQGGVLWNGVLLDITGLRQAEEKEASSRALLRLVLDRVPAYICAKDLAGRFLLVNQKLADFYGRPTAAMTGSLHADLCEDPEELRAMLADDREVIESGRIKCIPEETMKNPDGSSTVLETYKIPFAANNEPAVLVTSTDITERKRAERKIQQESLLNKTIIDSIPGTFYMLDETGNYMRWSAYQRDVIVGKPDDQVAGFPALATIHPDDRDLVQARIENVLRNGVEETVEGRVLLRGGPDFRWLLMTGRRMVVDGRPALIGIGIDITERKQAEMQVAQQLDELRRWQTVTLGREGRVAEMKREVNALSVRLGQPPPYPSAETP